jgi:glycosyltransferase involved in cell wall biosynthesis
MRVVYVSPMGGLGGAERCLLTAMAAVKRLGHEVRLISCTDGPLVEQARALGAAAEVVPMPAGLAATGESGGVLGGLARGPLLAIAAWRYARRLRGAVDEAHGDVVHSNGLKTHLLLAIARPAAPVVWHLHDFLAGRPVTARLLRWARRRASRAIAISRAVAADAGAVLPGLPIDTVMNAVDVERFSPGGGRAELAGDRSTVRVGLVATYARWKGQDLFLRAAARVVGERPELKVRFYIVGGAIYHTAGSQWAGEELDALARELGIAQRVVRVPFVADTAGVYRALDVVVHASTKPEPFGLTIAEAMA